MRSSRSELAIQAGIRLGTVGAIACCVAISAGLGATHAATQSAIVTMVRGRLAGTNSISDYSTVSPVFGIKVGNVQPGGAYSAPIVFDVVAPAV